MVQNNFFTRTKLIIFLTSVILFLIFLLRPQWEIAGDGYGYYLYLRSSYFDHDLKFDNEWARYDDIYGTDYSYSEITPISKKGNTFPVGLSIFWLPFFMVARFINLLTNINFSDLPGFSVEYQRLLGFGSIVYAIIGLTFLFSGLKKLFSTRASWIAVLAIIFLSPLPYYLIYEPLMSHALSLAINSVLFWYSIKLYQAEKITWKKLLFLGIISGATVLVRWQEAITLFLPAGILVKKYFENKIKNWQLFIPAISSIIIFMPQLLAWKYLYGSFFVVPQGQNFIQFSQLKILEVLFSGMHGLFSWHPFLVVALLGLFFSYKKDSLLLYLLLSVFAVQVLLNSSLADWWGGSAFGARKMLGTLFVFSYGFAFLFDHFYSRKTVYCGLLSVLLLGGVWNFLLMVSIPKGYLSLSRITTISELYSAPFKLVAGSIRQGSR